MVVPPYQDGLLGRVASPPRQDQCFVHLPDYEFQRLEVVEGQGEKPALGP